MRVRFTRRREPQASEEFCVLFLEDVRNMQARSRQEKLAAMGRVSAGIAHEIRNPLAAIAQANALLAEDATDPAQRQLTRMVTDNVERLKRIVDDVMEVAPGQMHEVGAIDANAQVGVDLQRLGARQRRAARRARACCRSSCPTSRSASISTPSTCAASSSTCSTTRAATRAHTPGRDRASARCRRDELACLPERR